ncbi:MAG TPA: hypothetical protein VIY48_04575 [Candidatus Paceibacterota bacterium]
MHSRGAVVVYGMRDREKLKQDLVKYNEPLKPDDLTRAERLFTEARTFSGRPAHAWDYEHCGVTEVSNILEDAAFEGLRVKQVWDAIGPGWIGHHNPKCLLVGDELGPLRKDSTPPHDVPFAPYRSTSGHYLMKALDKWNRFAVINSLTERTGEVRDLARVWEAFGGPNVVALGKRASRELTKQRIDHVDIPHPQFWRRFHHYQLDEYKAMIEEAACL